MKEKKENVYRVLTTEGFKTSETGKDRLEAARKLFEKGIKVAIWFD